MNLFAEFQVVLEKAILLNIKRTSWKEDFLKMCGYTWNICGTPKRLFKSKLCKGNAWNPRCKKLHRMLFNCSVLGAMNNPSKAEHRCLYKRTHSYTTKRTIELNPTNKTKTILKAIIEFGTEGIVCAANCQRTK